MSSSISNTNTNTNSSKSHDHLNDKNKSDSSNYPPKDPSFIHAKVKNKAPAPIQISAEQLIREANERRDILFKPAKKISPGQEGEEQKQSRRKQFEDLLRRFPRQVTNWIRYAQWEETIKEIGRARSIYERALGIEGRNVTLWLRYTEFEMRNKNVMSARNVFLRAISLLPRVDQLWYKFAYMEEMLGNVEGAREIYFNWMKWEPAEEIFYSFIRFERRYREWENVRRVFLLLLAVHSTTDNWIKFAKFEEEIFQHDRAHKVYLQAIDTLQQQSASEDANAELEPKIYGAFAKFLVKIKHIDEARSVYCQALSTISGDNGRHLKESYVRFERQYGDTNSLEQIILDKRRELYEDRLRENSKNYDYWFDYLRLEEENILVKSNTDFNRIERVRSIFQRAVKEVPLLEEKKYWKRYIYLWIYFAIFEEVTVKDLERADAVYKECINKIVPHKKFTFAKIWKLYAKFLIRQLDISAARKLMGQALGICPKGKLFKDYIELETELREFDRVRKIYEKFIEWNPILVNTWVKYAEIEQLLGDEERARGLYEIGLAQPVLDYPEFLWKGYIDFEYGLCQYEHVRKLYTRLLGLSEHVKVWISLANFEASIKDIAGCRDAFVRGYDSLKRQLLNEERVLLLSAWKEFEETMGSPEEVERITKMFPQKIKKRRPAHQQLSSSGHPSQPVNQLPSKDEEYVEYVWPDQKDNRAKLLDLAHKWKKTSDRDIYAEEESPNQEHTDNFEQSDKTKIPEYTGQTDDIAQTQ